jgi:type II secretory ATPase GspE/PulE/Tfp pilus assembly ATPase PilB-like protein
MLSSSILGVMGMRLVRRVCEHCAQIYNPERSLLKLVPPELIPNAIFRKGAGCEQCANTGYSGRLPVTELLVVNEPFREAILKKMPTRALEEVAIENGMRTLWQNGLSRALAGQSSLDEIIRVLAADMI